MALNPDVTRLLEILAATAQTPATNQSLYTSSQISQTHTFPPTDSNKNHDARAIPTTIPTPALARGCFSNIPGLAQLEQDTSTNLNLERTQFSIPPQQARLPMSLPDNRNTFNQPLPKMQLLQARKVDPSTITNWPAALKYVMGILAQDGAVMNRIKRMKENQHENERRWWASRDAIVRKHHARIEGKRKVEELLRDIGSSLTVNVAEMSTANAEAEELRNFDLKVHKAACDMESAMSLELSQLGVPFFSGGPGGTVRVDGEHGIDKNELKNLRKRMLELLGDMVVDD